MKPVDWSNKIKTSKIFYGWIIVAAGVVILAVGLGMFTSTNSLFVVPVCDSLGVTRAQFTFHRTIMTLASAAAMPLYGKAIRHFGVKKALVCGSFVLGVTIFGYSFASSLWHFYLLAFINGIFATAVNFMALGVLVNDWFDDKKGLALGIAYSGSGLGAALMIPIVSHVIEQTDWQFAYRFMGILGLVVLIPVILLLVKDSRKKLALNHTDQPLRFAGTIRPAIIRLSS